MINIIGARRLLTLFVLVLVNAALAYAVYMVIQPETEAVQTALNAAKSKESTTRQDIANLELEFAQLAKQQAEFDTLKSDGFFSTQSRKDAQKLFLDAERESGIISATVNVKPGAVFENEEAKKAEHVLLVSPVDIMIKAVDDTDIYKYIYLLEQSFPGHISTKNLVMTRKGQINDTTLRAIASRSNPPLVEANLSMTWRTMVPAADFVETPELGAGTP